MSAGGYPQRYDGWLAALEDAGVEGVGFGLVALHAGGAADPDIRVEDWPYPVEQPLGPWVAGHLAGVAAVRSLAADATLLATRFVVRPDVVQEQVGPPGAEDPERIILRQQRGLRRARAADTVDAALVGACDGTLPVGPLLDAVAALLGADPAALRAARPDHVRALVADGFLQPAG